ncbi:MAG: type 11 methyltransferase [Candidatus Magnetoglobus multicellularis str. Araruama]|uniref:Type 11 methyltransferase n=1 Tax=Candidatus Magnetoglobus multicellularis str. Araruama TaxID=890399 RepID=A0A1V1P318_9BACT|nr:MAG: type 11 methyltransferase [Candidatus Magnetoglobus multicellularis str. Araruama]
MIARARDKTNCHSHGILYDILDMSQEKQIGLFDMVTSVYLFPYAQSRLTLSRMCKTMTMNLKPDGKMVSVTLNPLLTNNCLDIQEQYGAKMIAQGPLIDGTSIQVILRTSQGNINLCNTYWTKKTYEQLLVGAGFSSIVWHQPRISPAGLETHGNDYWQNHLIHPGFSILKCQR